MNLLDLANLAATLYLIYKLGYLPMQGYVTKKLTGK